jgi:hypothetical protein
MAADQDRVAEATGLERGTVLTMACAIGLRYLTRALAHGAGTDAVLWCTSSVPTSPDSPGLRRGTAVADDHHPESSSPPEGDHHRSMIGDDRGAEAPDVDRDEREIQAEVDRRIARQRAQNRPITNLSAYRATITRQVREERAARRAAPPPAPTKPAGPAFDPLEIGKARFASAKRLAAERAQTQQPPEES